MNVAHLHLLISHVPMLGPIFGLILLMAALCRKSSELTQVSLWVFVLGGMLAIPTYLSGNPASALLSRLLPGMPMDAADQHAEIALVALVSALLLGIVALVGLVLGRKAKKTATWFTPLVLALSCGTSALMIWAGSLGGQIRHPEIQESRPFANIQRVEFDPANDQVIYVTTFGASAWKGPALP